MSKTLSSSYESKNFSSEKKFIKLTSTGNLNLELTLLLTNQEAELFKVFPDMILSISDCENFLKPQIQTKFEMSFKSEQFKKKDIYDFIRLSSENLTINSLLCMSRASSKKAFIEFITLSKMRFKPKNTFLNDFVKTICENNFLFLIENNLLPQLNSKVKFTIKIDNRVVKVFENICDETSSEDSENEQQEQQQEQERNEFYIEVHNNYNKDNENYSNRDESEKAMRLAENIDNISVKTRNESIREVAEININKYLNNNNLDNNYINNINEKH